ncbi:glycosyltransferase family 9 protein [Micromonospora haikouensis]|uniref:glycosyltransferase family 9 protein n=1 Tax=Micromonospora haikouensis TaxID=686309 RepID=UPI00159F0877|nr:glycosyltransferase family 9 protein [Micromonospora haikouensis]
MQRNILLEVVRRVWPGAEITLVVGAGLYRRFAELLDLHLGVSHVLPCPDPTTADAHPYDEFVARLAGRGFDLCVVDPGSHTIDAGHAERAGIGARVGLPRGLASDADLTVRVRLPAPPGRCDLYDYACAFARALGGSPPAPEQTVPPLAVRPEPVPELVAPGPRVGVHPGGQPHWNRRWPLERYHALCERLTGELGASLYLLGTAAELPELTALRERVWAIRRDAVVHLDVGRPLNRTANLLAGLDLLVGNDSGLAHVAAALGVPTVVLYGPTGTETLWSRVYPRHRGVSLRYPCQAITHTVDGVADRRCAYDCVVPYRSPRGPYPRCLTDLELAPVWAATTEQLHADQSGVQHGR